VNLIPLLVPLVEVDVAFIKKIVCIDSKLMELVLITDTDTIE